jgi:hypothetical protein
MLPLVLVMCGAARISICRADAGPGRTIAQVREELRRAYDDDIKALSSAEIHPDGEVQKGPEDRLSERSLLTPGLLHHVKEIGGLDFDILTNSQDWDPRWTWSVGEPVKSPKGFDISVSIARPIAHTTVTWSFVARGNTFLADDARYEAPHEKSFTLRSLKEGD